ELVELLQQQFSAENFHIVEADMLEVDIPSLVTAAQVNRILQPRVRVVANLPYYISTAVISKLIESRNIIKDMTLMLQREVAERIASLPGGRDYGALSVLSQLYCEVRLLFHVRPGSFRPIPKVESSILRLTVRDRPIATVSDQALLIRVVRAAFAQ